MDSYRDRFNAGRVRTGFVGREFRSIRLHNLALALQKLDWRNSHSAARMANDSGCKRGES
jgi:hypothetical protein